LVPIAGKGKLEPQWEVSNQEPGDLKISDGNRTKVVHTNRIQHHIQAAADSSESTLTKGATPLWFPSQVEHFIEETATSFCCNPPHNRQLP